MTREQAKRVLRNIKSIIRQKYFGEDLVPANHTGMAVSSDLPVPLDPAVEKRRKRKVARKQEVEPVAECDGVWDIDLVTLIQLSSISPTIH